MINIHKVIKEKILKGQRASVLKSDRTSLNALYTCNVDWACFTLDFDGMDICMKY